MLPVHTTLGDMWLHLDAIQMTSLQCGLAGFSLWDLGISEEQHHQVALGLQTATESGWAMRCEQRRPLVATGCELSCWLLTLCGGTQVALRHGQG